MASKTGRESDPLIGFNFRIEVAGAVTVTGYFTECSGIGSEHEVVDHKVVDDQGRELVQKIAGRLKWQDVTLKRGITDNMSMWDWRQIAVEGRMAEARANCSVIMMDRNYEDLARWDFVNAWPSKLGGPQVKSDSNEFGVEELTIVHEGMTRVS
jgi:phage tail-like protein